MSKKIKLGDYNRLRIVKKVDFGLYLDGGDEGEILLPSRYVPEDAGIGDELDVFIYLDQDERLIATTETPLAKVGDFAYLEVKWVNEYGAFLGWGLMKDIFSIRERKTHGARQLLHRAYPHRRGELSHRCLCQDRALSQRRPSSLQAWR